MRMRRGGGEGALIQKEKSATLATNNDQTLFQPVAYDGYNGSVTGDTQATIGVNCGMSTGRNGVIDSEYLVRRLTPLECERLQGFPDDWTNIGEWVDTNGKVHKESSDSARYKAMGNSIALPEWYWLLQRLSRYCGEDKTMGSLFDGVGGFPLLWSKISGIENCKWASEIEEFCIAVTKYHFGEGNDEN